MSMDVKCPFCGNENTDLGELMPDRACDNIDYECVFCGHEFKIGWVAEVEVRCDGNIEFDARKRFKKLTPPQQKIFTDLENGILFTWYMKKHFFRKNNYREVVRFKTKAAGYDPVSLNRSLLNLYRKDYIKLGEGGKVYWQRSSHNGSK